VKSFIYFNINIAFPIIKYLVASFLLSTLASEDINIVHLMDCREDTFLVIKESDAPLAFKALSEALRI